MIISASILFWVFAGAPATMASASRADHPFSVRADAGWNSLAGLGLRGSWAATPRLALDLGVGYVLSGPKLGARARWNFTTGEVAPFVALGGQWSAGRGDPQTVNKGGADEFSFHVGGAAYLQSVVGVDVQGSDRFAYSFELGWAQSVGHRDLRVISGAPSEGEWTQVRWIAGGGLVVGASIGYAF